MSRQGREETKIQLHAGGVGWEKSERRDKRIRNSRSCD